MIEETWLQEYVPTTGIGFIDVGANICSWTKWLAPNYQFVHAIEPFAEAIRAAGVLPPNVMMHNCGAWSKETQIHFGIYNPSKLLFAQEGIESYFADIGTNPPADANSLVLPCHTLDSMIPEDEQSQISFIKIDVEGSELQVLLGAQEIVNRSLPLMIVEIHSQKNAPKIEEMLKSQNYSIEVVRSPFYNEHQHFPHWSNHYWMICK